MNGFADHGALDEGNFGDASGISVKAFDAFPKTKSTYLTRTSSGGVWTVLLILTGALLTVSELRRWLAGETTHSYNVEHGVAHSLQINLDVVVAMQCRDLHVNVQDASGDRILAGDTLKKDATQWSGWGKQKGIHTLGVEDARSRKSDYAEDDVHDYLGAARARKKFRKTPKFRGEPDACRVYGSMEGNKVQGDFHITARGHGYMEFGPHLDHSAFNFSHYINELSFGPFYPSLTNPLDDTVSLVLEHFYKSQYYLSIVPTIYSTSPISSLAPAHLAADVDSSSSAYTSLDGRTVHTNQYAVTSQSHPVPESAVPGIFVKYDIEPITLTISEEMDSFLALLVRLVNVASGVLVAGGWCYQLTEWSKEVAGRRGRRRMDSNMGMLNGRSEHSDEKKGY
ncbi:MAG: hypothetical protein M1820_004151 [Bogoriella megaspora]|nr:MAG: hypothetical protein M1820_004151 [Bogoriella megaspora]